MLLLDGAEVVGPGITCWEIISSAEVGTPGRLGRAWPSTSIEAVAVNTAMEWIMQVTMEKFLGCIISTIQLSTTDNKMSHYVDKNCVWKTMQLSLGMRKIFWVGQFLAREQMMNCVCTNNAVVCERQYNCSPRHHHIQFIVQRLPGNQTKYKQEIV